MSKAALLVLSAELFGCYALSLFLFVSREVEFSLISILAVVIEIMILYSVLAFTLNNTYIELTAEDLLVRFAPIPWPGKKMLKRSEIRQLFCKESTRYDRYLAVKYVYELHGLTQDGRDIKLLGGQKSPDVVRYFEQVLEPWLPIEDQPVDSRNWRSQ
jgi:hypothetical protein